jgi:hypothetical protein
MPSALAVRLHSMLSLTDETAAMAYVAALSFPFLVLVFTITVGIAFYFAATRDKAD